MLRGLSWLEAFFLHATRKTSPWLFSMNTPPARPPGFWKILSSISAIAFLATASTIGLLYQAAYVEQLRDMERAAETLAALMESVAQFDLKFSGGTNPQGSRGATMSQIEKGMSGIIGRRDGEELVIGRRNGDRLQVLRATPDRGFEIAADLPFDGTRARPLFEALAGRRSSGRFLDYRNVPVVAAYAPVPSLEIGIVYKVDLAAMRAPFLRVGAWVGGVYLLLVGLLAAGYRRLTERLAIRLQTSETRLASVFELAPVLMLTLDREGNIEHVNPRFEQLTGWRLDEIRGREWFTTFLPERDRDHIRSFFRTVVNTGSVGGHKNPILTRAGEERLIDWHNQMLHDAGGRVAGVLSIGIDVTERQRQEEDLRVKESAMASAIAGIAIAGLDNKITYVNSAWLRMHGYDHTSAEAIGTSPMDNVANPADVIAIIAAMKTRGHWRGELRCKRRDGTVFPAELSCVLVTSTAGQPIGLLASFQDITERKRQEEALRASEERLQLAVGSGGVGLWEWNIATDHLEWNDQLKLIFGLSPEATGLTIARFVDAIFPEDREGTERLFRGALLDHTEFKHEYRIVWPDGTVHWILATGQGAYDAAGKPLRMAGAALDIDERKKNDRALEEKEAQLRAVVEGAFDGILMADAETRRFTFANHAMCRMLGVTEAELLTMGLADIHPPESLPELVQKFAAMACGELSVIRDVPLLRKDGSLRTVDISGSSVLFGRRHYNVGVFRDTTERRAAEQHIAKQSRLLELIFRHSIDNLVILDKDYNFVQVSESYARGCQMPVADFIGRNHFELFPSPFEQELAPYRQAKLTYHRSERPFVFPDHPELGTTYWDIGLVPIFDAAGEIEIFLFTLRDVTKRKRAEEALHASEARYRRAERGTNDGLWEWNIITGGEYFSPRWLAILGYDEGDLPNTVEAFVDLVHPDDKTRVWAAAERHQQDRTPFDVEMRMRCKDGAYLWVRSRGEAERDADGKPLRMTGSITDISENKRAAETLQHERDRLRQILDSQFGFVAVLDPDGTITDVNQTPLTLMGLTRTEVLGRLFWEVGWLETGETVPQVQAMIAAAALGESMHGDILARFPGVGRRDVEVSFAPLRDAAGSVVSVIGFGVDITERKQAEAALQENEGRLKEAQRVARLGSLDWNLATNELILSDEALEIYGLDRTRNKVALEELTRLLHPEDAERVQRSLSDAVQGIDRHDMEHRMVCPDGREIFIRATAELFRDTAGRPARLLGTVQDITERKLVEAVIRENESRFRRVVNSIPVGVAVVDHAGRIALVNKSLEKQFGYAPGELIGQTVEQLVPQRIQGTHPAKRSAYQAHPEARPMGRGRDLFARRKDGSEFPVEIGLQPFQFADETMTMAVVSDITERKLAEAAVRTSESRLNEAQRIAQIGSWELDLTTNKLHWSDEIFRLFEIDPARFGASYEAFLHAIHPDDREAVNAAYTGSLRDRRPYRIIHRLLMEDGRIKHVEEQCETDFDAEGRPLESRGTVQDVTERIMAESAIRKSLHEKEVLLREIHHRVKNNLQIIASLLHFQAKKLADPLSASVFAEARERLRSMILVHEKLYNSGTLSDVDFADYIRSLVDQLSQSATGGGHRIRFKIEAEPLRLPIESALPTGMILVELVTNILKYAYPGERTGEAWVRLSAAEGRVHLTVGDDGVGLPPAFNPENTRSFGWQLITNLTTQLDGEIALNRESGTHVTISFPHTPLPHA
jgi:PAS domain S-box-containing protein